MKNNNEDLKNIDKNLKINSYVKKDILKNNLLFIDFIDSKLEGIVPLECLNKTDYLIVEKFGLKRAKELDWDLLKKGEIYKNIVLNISPEVTDINVEIYNLIRDSLTPASYSDRMKKVLKDRYIDPISAKNEKEKDLIKNFNFGYLTAEDILSNPSIFYDKDLSYNLLKDKEKYKIHKVTLSNDTEIDKKEYSLDPEDLRNHIKNYTLLLKNKLKNDNIDDFFRKYFSIKDNKILLNAPYTNFSFLSKELLNNKNKDINMEERELINNLFLDALTTFYFLEKSDKTYKDGKKQVIEFISKIDTPYNLLLNQNIREFILQIGLNNIIDFDNENGNILTKNNCSFLNQIITIYLYNTQKIGVNTDISNFKDKKEKLHIFIKSMLLYRGFDGEVYRLENINDYNNLSVYFKNMIDEVYFDFTTLTGLTEEEINKLTQDYYNCNFTIKHLQNYPELIDGLKNKNKRFYLKDESEIKLISDFERTFDSEDAFNIFIKYYKYLDNKMINRIKREINEYGDNCSIEKKCTIIERNIYDACCNGEILYSPDGEDKLIQTLFPQLFLSNDTPDKIKKLFYNNKITFQLLKNDEELYDTLEKEGNILLALQKSYKNSESFNNYINIFKDDKPLENAMKKVETVEKAIANNQVELMKKWYDKTNKKYIPDYFLIENFPFDEADRFLSSTKRWLKVLENKDFTYYEHYKKALLKFAYSFGIFHNDSNSTIEIDYLLNSIPEMFDAKYINLLNEIEKEITNPKDKSELLIQDKELRFKRLEGMLQLYKNSNNYNQNKNKYIFSSLYYLDEDTGNLVLYPYIPIGPEIEKKLRGILNKYYSLPLINPLKIYQIFDGFKMEYDPEFKKFFLSNFDKIIEEIESYKYICQIQRQFNEIKKFSGNKKITLESAIDFVKNIEYLDVNYKDKKIAKLSSNLGYDEKDFHKLSQLYNEGKNRICSSIPNLEGYNEKFNYQTLRLDDPLNMFVGDLTGCCQALHKTGESCMIHSTLDRNGRVFVIKDKDNKIVAQSWVWRNKDTICFDNIEISLYFVEKNNNKYKNFINEIFDVYTKAANELIKIDRKEYRKLLDNNEITLQQYNELALSKVTVGLGYNRVAEVIKENTTQDGYITMPIVDQTTSKNIDKLYIDDSNYQYILVQEGLDKQYAVSNDILEDEITYIYKDEYIKYDINNFTQDECIVFSNMYNNYHEVKENKELYDLNEICVLYNREPDNLEVIILSNLIVVYEINNDNVEILDILYEEDYNYNNIQSNLLMYNKSYISDSNKKHLQLILDGLGKDRLVYINNLNEEQAEIINNVGSSSNILVKDLSKHCKKIKRTSIN